AVGASSQVTRRSVPVVLTLGGLAGEHALVDLPQGDRQRLLLRRGLHQWADVLQQALTELAVVRVDLARALGGVDDQTVLRGGLGQQLVDRRVGDALGGGGGSGHAGQPSRFGLGRRINSTNWSAAWLTSSLTIVTSNSSSAANSILAWSSRAQRTSTGSVPRPVRRRSSSVQLGGARNTNCASGMTFLTCRAPCSSISSTAGTPSASSRSTGRRGVPYRFPEYSAHSRNSPSAIIRSNSSSEAKW